MVKENKIRMFAAGQNLCPYAFYMIAENEIYYDERLDGYPLLKEFALEHERKHAENKYNIIYHMFIDVLDNCRMFRPEITTEINRMEMAGKDVGFFLSIYLFFVGLVYSVFSVTFIPVLHLFFGMWRLVLRLQK